MDIALIRSVASGLAGAVITHLLMRRWARSLPEAFAAKPIQQIVEENRLAVFLANGVFFIGLAIGVGMYKFGGYGNKDWTPIAVGFGIAFGAPSLVLWISSRATGRSAREAFVAFSIGQGTPLWATYGSLVLGVFLAIVGVVKSVT